MYKATYMNIFKNNNNYRNKMNIEKNIMSQ